MRGRLSDQDLSDYALNELLPEERLYVESMLAVSESCRNDVYEMLEVSQMLEEGFELEDGGSLIALSNEQRQRLIDARPPMAAWQKTKIVLSAAACLAACLSVASQWRANQSGTQMANVSSRVSQMVLDAVDPDNDGSSLSRINFGVFAAFAEDSTNWMPAASDVLEPMVCTPPSWLDGSAGVFTDNR